MDTLLCSKIDNVVKEFKQELYQNSSLWSEIRTPSELLDLEQHLPGTLNSLQAKLVQAVLETIHSDKEFVRKCQKQAYLANGMYRSRGGRRDVSVRTLSGQSINIRTPYIPPNQGAYPEISQDEKLNEGSGILPVLRKLGIVGRATPRFLAETNRQLTDGPSAMEARERLANREIICTNKPLWRHVRDFASIALWQRQQALIDLSDAFPPLQGMSLEGQRIIIGLDGGRLRIRIPKKNSTKAKHKGFTTNKCECKLFAVYTVDDKGEKLNNGTFFYEGTILSIEHLVMLLKLRLQQLRIHKAKLIVFIGDGAPWIWNAVADIRSNLDLENIPIFEVVDFAHAVGKLTKPGKVGIGRGFQRKQWLRHTKKLLKDGKVQDVIAELGKLDPKHDTDNDIRKATEYFQRHQERMQYAEFKAQGLPRGSGVIESAVRRIVNLRLKGSGTFWAPQTAESILYLRCQLKSGRWIPFVKSVLSEWANNMSDRSASETP